MTSLDTPMDSALSLPALPPLPPGLTACWRREYIKQSFRPPRATDSDEASAVGVRYVQSAHPAGLCVDLRMDVGGGDTSCTDCFAGLALWHEESQVLSWHPVVTSSEAAPTADSDLASLFRARAEELAAGVSAGGVVPSEDRARIVWQDAQKSAWLELDVDGGATVLEEKWVRMRAEGKGGDTELSLLTPRELLLVQNGLFAHVELGAACVAEEQAARPRFRFGELFCVSASELGDAALTREFRVLLDSWSPHVEGSASSALLLDTPLSRLAAVRLETCTSC